MTRDEVEELGATWPAKHPKTGDSFVRGHASWEGSTGVTQLAPPPAPPKEAAIEWDAEGNPTKFRPFNDDEMTAAMNDFRTARAAFGVTGGMAAVKKATLVGRFETDRGDWAEGEFEQGAWKWQHTS